LRSWSVRPHDADWTAHLAGVRFGKVEGSQPPVWLPPGRYDVYGTPVDTARPNPEPLRLAEGVEVKDGEVTVVKVATLPRAPESGQPRKQTQIRLSLSSPVKKYPDWWAVPAGTGLAAETTLAANHGPASNDLAPGKYDVYLRAGVGSGALSSAVRVARAQVI